MYHNWTSIPTKSFARSEAKMEFRSSPRCVDQEFLHHIPELIEVKMKSLLSLSLVFLLLPQIGRAQSNQILELRTYTLTSADAEVTLDKYLAEALIPALERQGMGPIGAFDQAAEADDGSIEVMLLIAGPSVDAVTGVDARLAEDEAYQQAAATYHETPAKEPVVERIRSELLRSFDCWPEVTVPSQKTDGKGRLFELRTYESPTEKFGHLKVEMFNAGEVPIFLDSGIMPVFMGQALIGDKLPNLTYMTVFDDDATRKAGWKQFSSHPDWQVLKQVQKYKGSVSKIHKSDWVPKEYSQL